MTPMAKPNEIPVALVCYNRPWHTAQVLKALMRHDVRNLYVFCDAPRHPADAEPVGRVRELIRAIRWTRPHVVLQEANQGLARSVVGAVNTVLAEHEQLILLEDDCVPKRHFFEFMHACLTTYRDQTRVFGINGYTVPIPPTLLAGYPYDAYFYPRIGSWGWATWRRAWRHYDTDLGRLYRRCVEAGVDLMQGGADIPENVQAFLGGRARDSWTLQWVLAVYLQGGCYIYPTVSQIRNIGFDGSGVHFGSSRSKFDYEARDHPVRRLPRQVFLQPELVAHYNEYFGGSGRPMAPTPPRPAEASEAGWRRAIVHINTHDVAGGAAKVAWRLAEAQRQAGHEARLLVGTKNSDGPHVETFAIEPDMQQRVQAAREGLLDYHLRGSDRLCDHPLVKAADVLHLHNLHGHYFNPFSLPELSQARPTVWTLHDMFAITGHCAYSLRCPRWQTGCESCPQLDLQYALPVDSSARLLRDKKAIYERSRLWVVTPSKWLYDFVKKSVLRDHPLELIYNGVDTRVFSPREVRAARARFGLPQDRLCVGAAANGGTMANSWKGGPYTHAVVEALHAAGIDCVFVHIGGQAEMNDPRWFNLGPIRDEGLLAEAYSALDVFLYTPLADNCPLVVLEAMACGVPVVSFATGGVPELVRSGRDGYITGYRDVEMTVQAMRRVLGDAALRRGMGDSARQNVLERFDHGQTAAAYERLYERVLEEVRSGPRSAAVSAVRTPAVAKARPMQSAGARAPAAGGQQTAEGGGPEPDVSLVVCTKNRAEVLDAMLQSLKTAAQGISCEVIVVDGASTDRTREVLARHGITRAYDEATHLGPGRHGWPVLYNFGFGKARGRYAMYASDDIVFEREGITRAVRYLDSLPSVVAGGILFYKNVYARPDWDKFGIDFTHGQRLLMNYGLVRRDCFNAVGGLDESYAFYCADADLCLKLYEAGKQLVPLPGCLVVHHNVLDAQKQANAQTSRADISKFFTKWEGVIPTGEPAPRRLLWFSEMAELYALPATLPSISAAIEPYWNALAQYEYQQYAAAHESFQQAMAGGLNHELVHRCAAQAARAAGAAVPAPAVQRSVVGAAQTSSAGRAPSSSQDPPAKPVWETAGSTVVVSEDRRQKPSPAPRRDSIQRRPHGPRQTPLAALSDNRTYPQVCLQASLDDRAFSTFRRNPLYTRILEHVTREQGAQYLEIIARDPELMRRMDDFRENDLYGGPTTCDYPGVGAFSPTTLRYIKVLLDLKRHFKTLDGLRIGEIGVGYGGQCRIINAFFAPKSYGLVDIRPALNLAQRYLDHFILRSTLRFLTMNELEAGDYDLVISNYAFTELSRPLQDIYLERIIRRSGRGYITYNEITPPECRSYKADELTRMIPGSRAFPEEPLTHPKNCIIVWGTDLDST